MREQLPVHNLAITRRGASQLRVVLLTLAPANTLDSLTTLDPAPHKSPSETIASDVRGTTHMKRLPAPNKKYGFRARSATRAKIMKTYVLITRHLKVPPH